MPKLPNKSITLIIAAIASVIISNNLLDKVLLFVSNASFGKADIIFNEVELFEIIQNDNNIIHGIMYGIV